MSYQNSGTMGKNQQPKSDQSPQYIGKLQAVTCSGCGCQNDYWLSGWVKEGANGKFFSLSVKEKESNQQQSQQAQQPRKADPGRSTDDIPF